MTTQTQAQIQKDESTAAKSIISGDAVLGYAVFGCLVTGTIGILRGITMEGVGAAACLLVSVAAFGTVCYVYLRKS